MGNKPTTTASNQLRPFAGTVLAGATCVQKELEFLQIHGSGIHACERPIMQFPRKAREELLDACFVTKENGEEEVCPNLAIFYANDGENRGIAIFCGGTRVTWAVAPHKLVGDVLADQLLQDQLVVQFTNAQAAEIAQSMVDYA